MKSLEFRFTKLAEKFLAKNSAHLSKDKVKILVKKAIRLLNGHTENVDVKRLQGYTEQTFRIRHGEIRIIFTLIEEQIVITAIIEEIERRGNISYA